MKQKIITQIGSLPYENPEEAVKYSLKHDIPFLPELPKLGDGMLDYIKNPGKLSCLALFKKQQFEVVKIQCVGPATLMLSGYDENEALEIILQHISSILNRLKAGEIILFLDEPSLGNAGFDFNELWNPVFSSFNVMTGIHTCGNMDWDKLFESNIEIISFDASQYDLTRYPKYKNFRNRGGKIAWGVQKKEDAKDFQKGDLLTLPCGMGTKLYGPKDCEKNLRMLRNAAKDLSFN